MTGTFARLRAVIAALVAILLCGAYAAPAASAEGLRAAKCCAERCDKPRAPDAARDCCPSVGAAGDVGAFTVAPKAAFPSTAVTAVSFAAFQPAAPILSGVLPPRETSPRAAPLFLRTLALRL